MRIGNMSRFRLLNPDWHRRAFITWVSILGIVALKPLVSILGIVAFKPTARYRHRYNAWIDATIRRLRAL